MVDDTNKKYSFDIKQEAGELGLAAKMVGVELHQHYAPPAFPIVQLPAANPHFSGREELLEQLSTVDIRSTKAVVGLGGVGKTQLVLAHAHRQRDNYDLIWWLNGGNAAQLDSDLLTLGQQLQLNLSTSDLPTGRRLVLNWLSSTDKRYLLIFDNVDILTSRELRSYLPGGRGHCLITSRNPNWSSLAQVIDTNVFKIAEANIFFQKRLGEQNDPALSQLAQELGNLPLALEHAAAYMETRRKDASSYLSLFQTRRRALWSRVEPPDAYHDTITTTWELAFEQVRETIGALDLLNLCCFLAPENIPISLVKNHTNELPESLANCVHDEFGFDDAVEALTRYSLLVVNNDNLNIHRLVQMVARDRLGKEKCEEWLKTAISLVSAPLKTIPANDYYSWTEGRQLLPHMRAVADQALEYDLVSKKAASLSNVIGYYLQVVMGNLLEAHPYYKRALAINEEVLGLEHRDTAGNLNNLGALLQAMGRFKEARTYYERALTINGKVFGADDKVTARSLGNLGYLLRAMGNLSEAYPYYERALAINQKELGVEHPTTAQSHNNLGYLLQGMGQFKEAYSHLERALAINSKVLGAEHPHTATSMGNLGRLLQEMGDLPQAHTYLEQALAIREKALGSDHPSTALSLNSLGTLLQKMGRFPEARTYLEQALIAREKALGSDHPRIAQSLNALGALRQATGNLSEARHLYERALMINKNVIGFDHPDTAQSLKMLAMLAFEEENFEEAAQLMENALDIWIQRLGSAHPDTESARDSLTLIESRLNPL